MIHERSTLAVANFVVVVAITLGRIFVWGDERFLLDPPLVGTGVLVVRKLNCGFRQR